MKWVVFGFLLIHLILLVGVFAALVSTLIARGSRSRSGTDRDEAHSMR